MKRLLIYLLLFSQMLGAMPLASYLEEFEEVKYEKEISKDLDEETKIIQGIKGEFSKQIIYTKNVKTTYPKIKCFLNGLLPSKPNCEEKDLLCWLCNFRI